MNIRGASVRFASTPSTSETTTEEQTNTNGARNEQQNTAQYVEQHTIERDLDILAPLQALDKIRPSSLCSLFNFRDTGETVFKEIYRFSHNDLA